MGDQIKNKKYPLRCLNILDVKLDRIKKNLIEYCKSVSILMVILCDTSDQRDDNHWSTPAAGAKILEIFNF